MSNCRNCGAPLPEELVNGAFVCEFCESANRPTYLGENPDRIIELAGEAGVDCPKCHTRMQSALLDGQPIAVCRSCEGLLISDEIFAATVRERRAAYGAYGRTPQPLNQKALHRKLKCAKCQRPMQTHPYHGPGNVVVDSCFPCRVIWVDSGELAQIETAPGQR
jgi:Zn-finger nucleic acid-binding protein